MGRLVNTDTLVKIIDKHTNDDNQLDNDITCILEEVPTAYMEEEYEKLISKAMEEKSNIQKTRLEALDAILNMSDDIRNKAIDEFAERLHELCGVEFGGYQYPDLLHESVIDEIAAQLKKEVPVNGLVR